MSGRQCGAGPGRNPETRNPETLDGTRSRSHNRRHERPFRNLRRLPGDYSLAHSWLRPSFLKIRDLRTPRPAGRETLVELRLYDTLSREKRAFAPLDAANVRMYVCGPTVYDFAHIGNARPAIVFDVLYRLLRHIHGAEHVTYVRNITDVDDKINDRAARDFPGLPLNEAIRKVTEVTEKQFHDDVDALGSLRPTVEPRATEHIAEMRAIIEKLVQGGFA